MRDYTEVIRERLLELPSVSQAQIANAKPYQIDVDIDEDTLNMLTMFAFLMAVGIVVDDGIVIGETVMAQPLFPAAST